MLKQKISTCALFFVTNDNFKCVVPKIAKSVCAYFMTPIKTYSRSYQCQTMLIKVSYTLYVNSTYNMIVSCFVFKAHTSLWLKPRLGDITIYYTVKK